MKHFWIEYTYQAKYYQNQKYLRKTVFFFYYVVIIYLYHLSVISPPAGLFWAMFNELMSSFLYWFKTDRYATVRWKNAVVAEAASRRYSEPTRRINKKMISYHDDQVCTAQSPYSPLEIYSTCNERFYNIYYFS